MMTALFIGKTTTGQAVHWPLALVNRHGLVAGATGTGKTVTLQTLAEGLSRAGVNVFMADVKGDLTGLLQPGATQEPFQKRAAQLALTDYVGQAFAVTLWDVWGGQGLPLRTTVQAVGPLLLSRMLELTEAQEGVINIAFRVAADAGWPLIDLADLRAVLAHVAANSRSLGPRYGLVSTSSVGAVQRQLLVLENQGAAEFFGEPDLKIVDLLQPVAPGQGMIHLLQAQRLLQQSPRLYATFLLWLLTALFESLPEVGDLPAPKLVFCFDEAHLLFTDAPKPLLEKIAQVVRLIRSKGVGVVLVTQSPTDIPEVVLSQLGSIIQHALRAHTPKGQADVKLAARNFRPNPAFAVAEVVTQLGIGEALVSVLEGKGTPSVTERVWIAPPRAQVGPAAPAVVQQAVAQSVWARIYQHRLERASAAEMLAQVASAAAASTSSTNVAPVRTVVGRTRQGVGEAFVKSVVRGVGSRLATLVVRHVIKSLTRR